jgi:hypothetical protein
MDKPEVAQQRERKGQVVSMTRVEIEMHRSEIHDLYELIYRVRAGSVREGITKDTAVFLSELLDSVVPRELQP